jgi:tRNA modification GTPase
MRGAHGAVLLYDVTDEDSVMSLKTVWIPFALEHSAILKRETLVIVGNKCDLPRRAEVAEQFAAVSALTGEGIPELRRRIREAIAPGNLEHEPGFITSVRHEALLKDALASFERARAAVPAGLPHEMLLLDLYAALQALDAITGATTADDILNRIFSTFCIGK